MTTQQNGLKIELSAKDMECLKHHAPAAKVRGIIEMSIVNALLAAAKTNGFRFEGEDIDATNDDTVKASLFNLDESCLQVIDADGVYRGWIFLVFGNDGYDLVSDYTTNLETFLAPVNALAETLGN